MGAENEIKCSKIYKILYGFVETLEKGNLIEDRDKYNVVMNHIEKCGLCSSIYEGFLELVNKEIFKGEKKPITNFV